MQEAEYWNESDNELEEDIQEHTSPVEDEQPILLDSQTQGLDSEQEAIVWWLVMFTCMFQCLHSMSTRAIEWLLKLFSALLSVLGRYSNSIADIARAFPSSLYRRADYIKDKVPIPPIALKVVCRTCHGLNDYSECIEKQGTVTIVQCCNECSRHKKQTPLLRSVVSCKGTTKYYPFLIYPYCSLISTLRCILLRPGFLDLCEEWRNCFSSDLTMCDVYDG